jgi:hypothetical protein
MRDQALLGLDNDRHGGQIAALSKLWVSTSSRSRPVSGGSPRSSVFPHVLRLAIHNAKTLNRIRTRENYLFGISHRNPRICQDAAPSPAVLLRVHLLRFQSADLVVAPCQGFQT